jgi:hypothetical protein
VEVPHSITTRVEGDEWEALGREPEAEDLAVKVKREEIKMAFIEGMARYRSDVETVQKRLIDPLKAAGELPPLEERRIFANFSALTAAVRTFVADLEMRRSGKTVRGPVSIGSLVKDHQGTRGMGGEGGGRAEGRCGEGACGCLLPAAAARAARRVAGEGNGARRRDESWPAAAPAPLGSHAAGVCGLLHRV